MAQLREPNQEDTSIKFTSVLFALCRHRIERTSVSPSSSAAKSTSASESTSVSTSAAKPSIRSFETTRTRRPTPSSTSTRPFSKRSTSRQKAATSLCCRTGLGTSVWSENIESIDVYNSTMNSKCHLSCFNTLGRNTIGEGAASGGEPKYLFHWPTTLTTKPL